MFENVTVLIVEDEPFIALELAEAVLERGGTVLGPAGSVSAALTILKTETPDAAVLDPLLPDDDVSPISMILSQARVPLVIYTGTDIAADVAQGAHLPPILRKPLPSAVIMEILAAELQRPKAA